MSSGQRDSRAIGQAYLLPSDRTHLSKVDDKRPACTEETVIQTALQLRKGHFNSVIDLGVDVAAEAFVEKAQECNADAICCSALLTTTMGEMKNVVKKAEESGIRDRVKIMIGGAPVTQSFCDSIGADYYTSDAATASDVALKICLGEPV